MVMSTHGKFAHAQTKDNWVIEKPPKKLEPLSGASGRGARAAYHDEYPRDFGSRIAYTVSLGSDTSRPPIRQGGREGGRERNVGP